MKLLSSKNFNEVKKIDLDKVGTRFYTLYSGFTNKRFMLTSRVTLDRNQKLLTLGSTILMVNKMKKNLVVRLFNRGVG